MDGLFSINSDQAENLNNRRLTSEIKSAFLKNRLKLSEDSRIDVINDSGKWEIYDNKSCNKFSLRKNGSGIIVSKNLHIVNEIVDQGLCTGCGACEPACPVNIISFNSNSMPFIANPEDCIVNCTKCLKVCPGKVFDFNSYDDEMFGVRPNPESITGVVRQSFVSFSNDDEVRKSGSSGGFVSQLLIFMLEQKIIDGALVMTREEDEKGFHLVSKIARTTDEIKKAARSKYIVVPHLQALKEIEEIEGKYAVVALPCHIHAIRKYQKTSKKLKDRIKYIIGLFCNVAYEPYLIDDIIEFSNLKREEIVNFEFRAGQWPGSVELTHRDGHIIKPLPFEEIKDTINTVKLFYTAPRCNMCIDFSAEYADLSVGDPWLRSPEGDYLFEDGRSTVLTRTTAGDEIIRLAVEKGYISVKELPLKTYMINFETNAKFKRDFVPKNIMMKKLLHYPVPDYYRPFVHKNMINTIIVLIKLLIRYFSKYKIFRKISLAILSSKVSIRLLALNRKYKSKKFAIHYSRMEKFVNRIMLKTPLVRTTDE